MGSEHLRSLKDRYAPDDTYAQMAERAGMPTSRLREAFKARAVDRLPSAAVVSQLAAAIGCRPDEVLHALLADRGYPWGERDHHTLTERMHVVWGELSESSRIAVLDYARDLMRGESPRD